MLLPPFSNLPMPFSEHQLTVLPAFSISGAKASYFCANAGQNAIFVAVLTAKRLATCTA
jgi:hypothetical protein